MKKKMLPERTVERLSEYRRTLLRKLSEGTTHIHSHSLASMHGITAVQVRRDLMLIGFSSDNKKGYNVSELIDFISSILDSQSVIGVAVVGMGRLAIPVYPIDEFAEQCKRLSVRIALLTLPAKAIDGIRHIIDASPVEGVLNFTSKPFTPAEGSDIYVEDYDIITLLEKVAYFIKDDDIS